jgi:hypothetical protein
LTFDFYFHAQLIDLRGSSALSKMGTTPGPSLPPAATTIRLPAGAIISQFRDGRQSTTGIPSIMLCSP